MGEIFTHARPSVSLPTRRRVFDGTEAPSLFGRPRRPPTDVPREDVLWVRVLCPGLPPLTTRYLGLRGQRHLHPATPVPASTPEVLQVGVSEARTRPRVEGGTYDLTLGTPERRRPTSHWAVFEPQSEREVDRLFLEPTLAGSQGLSGESQGRSGIFTP